MTNLNGPVTELVQIPIRVSVVEFLDIFARELEPVLLAQPGIISILTGPTTKAEGEKETHPFVVSLTQWVSMDAHATFLAGPSAGPFFAKLESLTLGPPTVEHYRFGRLSPFARESRYARVVKLNPSTGQTGSSAAYERQVQAHGHGHGHTLAVTAPCVEIPSLDAIVLFGDEPRLGTEFDGAEASRDIRSSYVVKWKCVGVAQGAENL